LIELCNNCDIGQGFSAGEAGLGGSNVAVLQPLTRLAAVTILVNALEKWVQFGRAAGSRLKGMKPMSNTLTLVVEGLGFPVPGLDGLTVISCALGELDHVTRKVLDTSDPEWIGALRVTQVSLGFAQGLLSLAQNSSGQGIVVPLQPPPGMPDLWKTFPPAIAYLVPRFQQTAALLIHHGARHSFQDDDNPWESGQWKVESLDNPPQGILHPPELPPLIPRSPRTPNSWPRLLEETVVPWARTHLTPTRRTAFLAGLWLLQDDLDRSHSLSQQIEEADGHYGDYWHAIMHRREPDYGNAQYWFRRVGRHPAQLRLAELLAAGDFDPVPSRWCDKLARSGWDSLAFVDLCEAAESSPELDTFARRVQWCEMLHLLCETARTG